MDEQRRRQFEAAATQWGEHGRGVRVLLDPIELADAELWQQTDSAVQLGQITEVRHGWCFDTGGGDATCFDTREACQAGLEHAEAARGECQEQ